MVRKLSWMTHWAWLATLHLLQQMTMELTKLILSLLVVWLMVSWTVNETSFKEKSNVTKEKEQCFILRKQTVALFEYANRFYFDIN